MEFSFYFYIMHSEKTQFRRLRAYIRRLVKRICTNRLAYTNIHDPLLHAAPRAPVDGRPEHGTGGTRLRFGTLSASTANRKAQGAGRRAASAVSCSLSLSPCSLS